MVSKPNPDGDAEIRARLYNSYEHQMPMWDYPDDYYQGNHVYVSDPKIDDYYEGNPLSLKDPRDFIDSGGCYNCNAAFKLGSGPRKNASFNAYDAPSQFFYIPATTGGRRPRRKKTYEHHERKQEAESDWYSLVKELVPLGFKIGDIIKIFL